LERTVRDVFFTDFPAAGLAVDLRCVERFVEVLRPAMAVFLLHYGWIGWECRFAMSSELLGDSTAREL
jgi:hypothetical protein